MHSPVDTTTSGLGDLKAAIAEIVAVEDAVIERILAAALAGGHVLIDGVPGVGKTLLARTVARCLGVGFRRIQFTNDLMPTDVVGGPVWKAHEESFAFVPGPLFSDVVLADEINRTSPRTLSCLLEAMELGRVTVDGVESGGVPRHLPDPGGGARSLPGSGRGRLPGTEPGARALPGNAARGTARAAATDPRARGTEEPAARRRRRRATQRLPASAERGLAGHGARGGRRDGHGGGD